MTLGEFQIFLDIGHDTWANYRAKKDFIGVTKAIDGIIYDQKFTGAAADLLYAHTPLGNDSEPRFM